MLCLVILAHGKKSGNSSDFCGNSCQSEYGVCDSPTDLGSRTPTSFQTLCSVTTSSTSLSSSSSSISISDHGECGISNNQTCTGSLFGSCCSEFGFWYGCVWFQVKSANLHLTVDPIQRTVVKGASQNTVAVA